MAERFLIAQEIDGIIKRKRYLTRGNMEQMIRGIYYAKTKDYLPKRQKVYGEIYKKLKEVKG